MFAYSAASLDAIHANRQPLLAALAALNITEVSIRYEGGGDSGDVMEVMVKPEEQMSQLTTTQMLYHSVLAENSEGHYQYKLSESSISLDDALRDFTLTWVNAHHGGWENDEGGDGTVTLYVPANHCQLAHSECYTERNDYAYSL